MREVSVIGVGMIPFGKYLERKLADLGWPAVKAAIADAGSTLAPLRRRFVARRSAA